MPNLLRWYTLLATRTGFTKHVDVDVELNP